MAFFSQGLYLNKVNQIPSLSHSKSCMFIPGLMTTSRFWRQQTPTLVQQDYVVHYADTLAQEDIKKLAVVNAARITEPTTLIAHSMGCYIAIEMARMASHKVHGLVLINGTVTPPLATEIFKKTTLIKKLAACSTEQYIKLLSPEFFSSLTPKKLCPAEINFLQEMAVEIGPNNALKQLKATLTRGDMRSSLQQLMPLMPIRIIHGQEDRTINVPNWRALTAAVHNGLDTQFIEVPQAGHLLPIEHPILITQLINNFLAIIQARETSIPFPLR